MIVILYKDTGDSSAFDTTYEWLAENEILAPSFFVNLNEDMGAVASEHNLTIFPAIISIGNFDIDGTELFVKYAEGVDAITALSAEIIEEIKSDVIPASSE